MGPMPNNRDDAVDEFVSVLSFDSAGLIPAIAQQVGTGEVLMLAWMNADAVRETMRTGRATYWSRSRGELWRKGD
ncbi:MAG: phosphoribosyl-AMP cyclohydrolase, partial [Actinobacteria bacterium]|nr:phosphoribosyl-AMP cyclohydrolase [Actinomycetota bacterium]